jgi:hypothetical protein
MDYTSDPDGGGAFGPSNEHPNAHDYEELQIIYAHFDSTSTVGAALPNSAPAAMTDIDLEGPNQWGNSCARAGTIACTSMKRISAVETR